MPELEAPQAGCVRSSDFAAKPLFIHSLHANVIPPLLSILDSSSLVANDGCWGGALVSSLLLSIATQLRRGRRERKKFQEKQKAFKKAWRKKPNLEFARPTQRPLKPSRRSSS